MECSLSSSPCIREGYNIESNCRSSHPPTSNPVATRRAKPHTTGGEFETFKAQGSEAASHAITVVRNVKGAQKQKSIGR
eukprot:6022513-Amphidinium_carterae.1